MIYHALLFGSRHKLIAGDPTDGGLSSLAEMSSMARHRPPGDGSGNPKNSYRAFGCK
jgi:hypothetical protein